jgi:hypothetical protein
MPNMGVYSLNFSVRLALSSILAVSAILPSQAQVSSENPHWQRQFAQTPAAPEGNQPDDFTEPDDSRSLVLSDSILSLQGGEKVMAEAKDAINGGKYDIAAEKLQQARKIFNQLSNFHLQLANSFSGIDSGIYEAQRNSALKMGQLRDEATYQLALVHRAQNQPELAVPLLIQVIRSQNPASELGKKSYQQLYEIGFVATPYTSSPAAPAAPATIPPGSSQPVPPKTGN